MTTPTPEYLALCADRFAAIVDLAIEEAGPEWATWFGDTLTAEMQNAEPDAPFGVYSSPCEAENAPGITLLSTQGGPSFERLRYDLLVEDLETALEAA